MAHNPDFSHRRSIRLRHYDYDNYRAYFVTICTHQKQCIFGERLQRNMRLSNLGAIAYNYWLKIPQHFSHVTLDIFVIMPNHIHGIVWLNHEQKQSTSKRKFGDIVAGSLSSIIRSYKAAVTKEINLMCGQKGTSLVWQRNYYEHIIRDEKALQNIRKYIQDNPLNWDKDPEYSASREILLDLPF